MVCVEGTQMHVKRKHAMSHSSSDLCHAVCQRQLQSLHIQSACLKQSVYVMFNLACIQCYDSLGYFFP